PTAALGDPEVRRLFGVIRSLREAGIGIVYISHRLDEIFEIADRVTVLRDGTAVATHAAAPRRPSELIAMMVGREVAQLLPIRARAGVDPAGPSLDTPALELVHLSNPATGVRDVSLVVGRGEIVGLAGLVGCGRSELAEMIFGLTPASAGEIRIGGAAVT